MRLDGSDADGGEQAKPEVTGPQSFQPVADAPELTSGEVLLVEAYAAIWLVAFVLLVLSFRKHQRIERRIDELETAIAAARSAGGAEKAR